MVELTVKERLKISLKQFLSLVFSLCCGFSLVRLFSRPALTIIVYHRIIEDEAGKIVPYISVRRSALRRQLQFFKRHYQVIPLAQAVKLLQKGRIDAHYLSVTFDDGYRDNFTLGMDLFKQEGIVPTIFVTTGCIETQQMLWPDQVREIVYSAQLRAPARLDQPLLMIPVDQRKRIPAVKSIITYVKGLAPETRSQYLQHLQQLLHTSPSTQQSMLTWEDIRMLSRDGAAVGSHTVSHAILSSFPREQAWQEIHKSKVSLEGRLGMDVNLFAYPNGTAADFNDSTVALLKQAGYLAAVTTIRGVNRAGADPFRLKRTGVYRTDSLADIKFKLVAEALLS